LLLRFLRWNRLILDLNSHLILGCRFLLIIQPCACPVAKQQLLYIISAAIVPENTL